MKLARRHRFLTDAAEQRRVVREEPEESARRMPRSILAELPDDSVDEHPALIDRKRADGLE